MIKPDFDNRVGFGSKPSFPYEYYHIYSQLACVCVCVYTIVSFVHRCEQMIQFHTFPFQKHQVIHQQYFSLSSVTKIPHCESKTTETTSVFVSVTKKYYCE